MTKQPVNTLNTKKILVSPSILAADFSKLAEEISRVEQSGCDLIHLDIMDGHFVPNITFGPPIVKSIRQTTSMILDTHLMISDPLKYIKPFADAGSDHITFHIESDGNPDTIIDAIRAEECSVGITLKPGTPVETILPYLPKVDLVLVMTVEPGFGGQHFMEDMMPKTRIIKDAIKQIPRNIHLEVDGGIDNKTVITAAKAGANMMVAGTSVFKNPAGATEAIASIHAAEASLYQ